MFVFRDGCRFLRSKADLLHAVFALTSDPSIAIVKDCYHILINLSADETLHQVISPDSSADCRLNLHLALTVQHYRSSLIQVLVADVKVLPVLLKKLLDPEYVFADQICSILSNLTRHTKTCKTVLKVGSVSCTRVHAASRVIKTSTPG